MKAGAAVDKARATGATPLYVAAQNGHLTVVEALVKAGATVDQAEANGVTPLYIASQKGHTKVCTFLLESGAHREVRMRGSGWTPLFVAAWAGKAAAVKALLFRGADRNAATTAEHMGIPAAATPLSVALSQRHAEVAALLQKA